MQWSSWCNGTPIRVEAEYGVSGCNSDENRPYVNHIPSLKQAVQIARTYGGLNTNKGAGRVKRTLNIFYPPNNLGLSHISLATHEWYVYEDGQIESSGWRRDRGEWNPGKIIANLLAQHELERAKQIAAAAQPTEGMTPAEYEMAIYQALQAVMCRAQHLGYWMTYDGPEANRKWAERKLIDEVNTHLMQEGLRTVQSQSIERLFQSIPATEVAAHRGFMRDTKIEYRQMNQLVSEAMSEISALSQMNLNDAGKRHVRNLAKGCDAVLQRFHISIGTDVAMLHDETNKLRELLDRALCGDYSAYVSPIPAKSWFERLILGLFSRPPGGKVESTGL